MTDTDAELIAEAESQAAILEELFDSADEHGAYHYEEGCVVCDSPKNAAGLLRRLAERLASLQDDPELDATDFAHPAWWRGNDRGAEAVVEIVRKILDGKDDRGGFFREPLETLRRDLLGRLASLQGVGGDTAPRGGLDPITKSAIKKLRAMDAAAPAPPPPTEAEVAGVARVIFDKFKFRHWPTEDRWKAAKEAAVSIISVKDSKLSRIFTQAGGISLEEMEDAADIVERENLYLAGQLRVAAAIARAILSGRG